MERRVVITAEAAITPIGNTDDGIFDSLTNGVSGVRPMRGNDELEPHITSKVFGTVDYEIPFDFARPYRKTMGPVSLYACQVAKEALASSGLDKEFITSGRMGVAFSSTHGSPTVVRSIYRALFSGSKKAVSNIGAAGYLKSMVHTTAANITKMFGITGRLIASGTACTTGSQAIGFAYETVKFGLQDAMLCGAADEYDTTAVAMFSNLLAASKAYNDEPSRTPRPFDAARDGLVVGEGAGVLVLEEYEHAKKRGAEILAEVIGFSCNNNGGDLILPSLKGVKPAIQLGLDSAGIDATDVDFVSAHATGTRMGDIVEAQAIHQVYGDRPLVSGLKGYMGHTMAACGAIELICTLHMIKRGAVVPTLNLDEVDPRCEMINHTMQLREQPIRVAAVQNFAFGGVNTCLLVRRFDG